MTTRTVHPTSLFFFKPQGGRLAAHDLPEAGRLEDVVLWLIGGQQGEVAR